MVLEHQDVYGAGTDPYFYFWSRGGNIILPPGLVPQALKKKTGSAGNGCT